MHLWGRRWGAHGEEQHAQELEGVGAVQMPSAPLCPVGLAVPSRSSWGRRAAGGAGPSVRNLSDTSHCSASCPQPYLPLRGNV